MTLKTSFDIFQNVLSTESRPEQGQPDPTPEIARFTGNFIKAAKRLFDSKFPLSEIEINGTKVQFNKVLTDELGTFDLMYLPYDETRVDKEEQVKIDNRNDGIAIAITKSADNPQVTFKMFDISDDSTPERQISSETNTDEAIHRAKGLLRQLTLIDRFDLVYSPQKPH